MLFISVGPLRPQNKQTKTDGEAQIRYVRVYESHMELIFSDRK